MLELLLVYEPYECFPEQQLSNAKRKFFMKAKTKKNMIRCFLLCPSGANSVNETRHLNYRIFWTTRRIFSFSKIFSMISAPYGPVNTVSS